MPATTTTVANAIDTIYEPGFVDEVYRYSFLGISVAGQPAFPQSPTNGGTSVNWKVLGAGQTAATFTEGAVASAASNQTYYNASVSPTYFRVMTEWTGHLRDALQGGAAYFDAIASELDLARQDLISLVHQTFMGATESGLEVIIDNTTTYAGITRSGSPTYFSSAETAVSGSLALSNMEDMVETLMGTSYDGKPGLIIVPPNQKTNYFRLGGVAAAANNSVRVMLNGNGTPLDLGYQLDAIGFQGIPMMDFTGITTSIMLFLDIRPGIWSFRVHRPFRTDYQGRDGDADVYQHSFAALLQCRRPRRQGKLTGITV